MSNHVISTEASRSSCDTSKPSSKLELYEAGYQQALNDFAILPLLHRLQAHPEASIDAARVTLTPQEAQEIATLFIQTLNVNLDGKVLAIYLDNLRCNSQDLSQTLASLQLSPPAVDLPPTFPNVEMSRFLYGDRLRWISSSEITDWGIAIGRFYRFAPHCSCWRWCYLIWLDPDSPSSTWVKADIAWEDDLQACNLAHSDRLAENQSS